MRKPKRHRMITAAPEQLHISRDGPDPDQEQNHKFLSQLKLFLFRIWLQQIPDLGVSLYEDSLDVCRGH